MIPRIDIIRTILPPVKKMRFTGFGEEADRQATQWGWCELLQDVSPIVRMSFSRHKAVGFVDFGLGERMKDDIFGRYGLLNGHCDGQATFTWAIPTTLNPNLVINGSRPAYPPIDPHFIHLPLGWVKNVIATAEFGITRVEIASEPRAGIKAGEKTFMSRRLYGMRSVDGDHDKFEILTSGHGVRFVPWIDGASITSNEALRAQGI